MITFYDPAGKLSQTWLADPWKVRYVLNMKKLPFHTVYVEFPDIERVSKEAGIGPSMTRPDGSPYYTLPAIVDDSTGVAISDSFKIAEYLDKQYPDTPKVFPDGTEGLQAAFYRYYGEQLRPMGPVVVPLIVKHLNEASVPYFVRTRSFVFGKPLDQVRPVGEELEEQWAKIAPFFDALESWYAKSSGRFLVGDRPSFADFAVGGVVYAVKLVCGENGEDWKRLAAMNNGRLVKLVKDLEPYAGVTN